jgi:ABC-type uncharacterized transport system substrate-binding protein
MPVIFSFSEVASSGGLTSCGINLTDTYRHASIYTGKILTGAKPADLPVQQVTKLELVIIKTAKALGIEVPGSRPRRRDGRIDD